MVAIARLIVLPGVALIPLLLAACAGDSGTCGKNTSHTQDLHTDNNQLVVQVAGEGYCDGDLLDVLVLPQPGEGGSVGATIANDGYAIVGEAAGPEFTWEQALPATLMLENGDTLQTTEDPVTIVIRPR